MSYLHSLLQHDLTISFSIMIKKPICSSMFLLWKYVSNVEREPNIQNLLFACDGRLSKHGTIENVLCHLKLLSCALVADGLWIPCIVLIVFNIRIVTYKP
ncbi:hypothetical protein AMTRI_Chr03g137970 [Amborella trichopoda]